MNTSILVKCLDELKKDTPNISYVQGILETFITLSGNTIEPHVQTMEPNISQATYKQTAGGNKQFEDETEDIPGFLKPGPVGNITY